MVWWDKLEKLTSRTPWVSFVYFAVGDNLELPT